MLVHFTVSNFRSFKNEKTLSLEAVSSNELEGSLIRVDNRQLLPVAVLYGANSSGKSNVLLALRQMRHVVMTSIKLNIDERISYDPFILSSKSAEQGTTFEIQFYDDCTLYRYGFSYMPTHIIEEWLFRTKQGETEVQLFDRVGTDIEVCAPFTEAVGLERFTAPNRLFLSLVAQMNGEIAQCVLRWFGRCIFLSGLDSERYEPLTLKMLQGDPSSYGQLIDFFNDMQLGFQDIVLKHQAHKHDKSGGLKALLAAELDRPDTVEAFTTHHIYDDDGEVIGIIDCPKEQMESEGTKKVIELSGPIFEALQTGRVVLVDELDAKLHPILTRSIISLFMNKETNPHGAQLICSTHDTHLLDTNLLRKDQIWFTEKDPTAATDLYSLVEFRSADQTAAPSIEQEYIDGRYGAIPYLGRKHNVIHWEDK